MLAVSAVRENTTSKPPSITASQTPGEAFELDRTVFAIKPPNESLRRCFFFYDARVSLSIPPTNFQEYRNSDYTLGS
jgi:hypothetical protein